MAGSVGSMAEGLSLMDRPDIYRAVSAARKAKLRTSFWQGGVIGLWQVPKFCALFDNILDGIAGRVGGLADILAGAANRVGAGGKRDGNYNQGGKPQGAIEKHHYRSSFGIFWMIRAL
jgi:hypothetical protein